MSYNPNTGSLSIGSAISGATPGQVLYVDDTGVLGQSASAQISSGIDYNPVNFYSPLATKKWWLDFGDATKMLKTGGGNPTNGQAVETMLDSDGVTQLFQQLTGANQPTFVTGSTGSGRAALQFNATQYMEALIKTQTVSARTLSLGMVFCGPDSAVNTRVPIHFRAAVNNNDTLKLTSTSTSTLVLHPNTSGSVTTLTVTPNMRVFTNNYHAILIEWQAIAGRVFMWLDKDPTIIFDATVNTAGSINPNPSHFIRIGETAGSGQMRLADMFLFTSTAETSLMTDFQREQWFAAAKTRFGITYY